MTMQNCPSCGVHQTPQPKAKIVHDDCHANHNCDGCEAYLDRYS